MKKIVMTGASGFVGRTLTRVLIENGYIVVPVGRKELSDHKKLTELINGSYGIINLAGANIVNRWSDPYKKLLYSSRLDTTTALIVAIKESAQKPQVLISTSAVGIYKNNKPYHEENGEYSDDFLANLCKDWESKAQEAVQYGVRTAIFRFGIVLGEGGALAKMLPPFRFGLGGTIGDGSQPFSFIHIEDLARAYLFALEGSCSGAYNLTAPIPTTNKGLTETLGKILGRPTLFPVPEFVLRLIFGEGSKVLTDGQTVIPKRLLDARFSFLYPTIEKALEAILHKK